jgi:CubicO group peptidase (beta-lactamase class C family)
MCDWEFMANGLAKLSPLFPVGEKLAYQAHNARWMLGEIVRRTDPKKRSYQQFIREELCEPLQLDDLWVGIDDPVEPRIARLVDAGSSGPMPPEDSLLAKAAPNSIRLVPEIYELPHVRRACLVATGGIFTARSGARFWAMLANGGELDGVRLLSKERVKAIGVPLQSNDCDPVFFQGPMPLTQGGFWLYDENMPFISPAKGTRSICYPGVGGSLGWADLESGLAVMFCHNYMTGFMTPEAHPAYDIANVIRESLGLE